MRKILFTSFLLSLFFVACKDKPKVVDADYDKISAIDHETAISRFDKEYFEFDINDLDQMMAKYPFFFPGEMDPAEFLGKRNDSLWQEVYQEVQTNFPTNDKFNDVAFLFKAIKFHFPEKQVPNQLITVVGDMEKDFGAIYTDSLAIITLETYLGQDHKYYTDFPQYLRSEYNADQMAQDMATKFAYTVIAPTSDKSLLANMIQQGKILYLKDALLSYTTDAEKMNYTPEQIVWCQENESEIWSYLVDKKLLFDSDSRLDARFVRKAPFSKFYLEIDQESPGRTGVWLGWQIVKSYMQHNDVSLQTMLTTEPKDIFENSKYKPKK
ncbi:gliding motility lipoprotein GldB [Flavobacterium agricola]|uniref:Gliding motility lipoprotein GldB n=1 Tax=Flavobacterium agricola TaxID=2870839 RepID=A0ABY6LWE8_9FLAO|nr:gliding motility lipoprotein GldB [Flavobacterium agricola]UYW00663.1 gliding motility lipoprotein GldB [Flavobacterium agricola]